MTRLVITDPARRDLDDAAASYDERRAGLGRAFLEQVDHTLENVSLFPEGAPTVFDHVRKIVVQRFPFCIVYRVGVERVDIIAVLPTRTDPSRLLSRLGMLFSS